VDLAQIVLNATRTYNDSDGVPPVQNHLKKLGTHSDEEFIFSARRLSFGETGLPKAGTPSQYERSGPQTHGVLVLLFSISVPKRFETNL
jgi:hypothetical protein